ncbi:MAG: adenylate/guanylate cyclase domain-containing protein [Candidatus Omnitrophica bacterium]|nr:adenylate/guanylate cyclase domain-containing protein [Candidatus Omnitrophota bacterium]
MTSKVKNHFQIIVPLCALILAVFLRLFFPSLFKSADLKVFDHLQKMKPRPYLENPVVIVDIDDESLQKLGQWPWPRNLSARLIERLKVQGATAIAWDAVFAEPDRTSPENILPLWTTRFNQDELQKVLQTTESHDQLFSRAILNAPVITGFSLTTQANEQQPVQKAGFAYSGDSPVTYLPLFRGAVTNLKQIAQNASGNGSFNILTETDGIIRRVPLVFNLNQTLLPSLAAEILRVAQNTSGYGIKSAGAHGELSFGEKTGITAVKIGSLIIPTGPAGQIWLYDSGPVEKRSIPAWKIFDPKAELRPLKNALILIGTSAAGLKDIRATPLNPVAAGVEIHAQVLEQIINRQFLYRPDWIEGAEFLTWIVFGSCLIFLMPVAGAAWCALTASAAILSALAACWFAFSNFSFLIDPIVPSFLILILYLISSLIHFLQTDSEKKQVREAFSHYLSPALLEELVKNPHRLKLGGETKPMSVLFADIRNFTNLSELLTAEELTKFMNQYLTPMSEIIMREKGTIDKYMGDCIMAFWGAPLSDGQHAERACRAALKMQQHLKDWNVRMKERVHHQGKKFVEICTGIGINTGECCVGNMGSDQRFDYTVLGDEVNLASRLEGLSKTYGTEIIIGEKTFLANRSLSCIELDLIRVKGKDRPSRIYALIGDELLQDTETFKSLQHQTNALLNAYRLRNWQGAEESLQEIEKMEVQGWNLKTFCRLYHTRIDQFKVNPPPSVWDGSWTASSK